MDNTIKINPMSYYNGFISASRNIFLTSTVSLAIFSYSNTFKIKSSIDIAKSISICIIIFSILYGINTTYGMYKFINVLTKNNDSISDQLQINLWKNFVYLNSYYIILLIILVIVALRRFINNF